jgi:hypothetical protein
MLGLYLSSKNKKSISLGIYFQHERLTEASIQHGYCDFAFLDIWIIRNNKIFNNQEARWSSWKAIYMNELRMLKFRMKQKFYDQFVDWLQNVT